MNNDLTNPPYMKDTISIVDKRKEKFLHAKSVSIEIKGKLCYMVLIKDKHNDILKIVSCFTMRGAKRVAKRWLTKCLEIQSRYTE